MPTKLSVEDLRELIRKGEATDPLIFLESVMSGQDPRSLSKIYMLAQDIQDFSGGTPTPDDWAEIYDAICESLKFKTVSFTESSAAAKTLAEYLHPKRKQVEQTGIGVDGTQELPPLTEEDIILFKEKFNDEF